MKRYELKMRARIVREQNKWKKQEMTWKKSKSKISQTNKKVVAVPPKEPLIKKHIKAVKAPTVQGYCFKCRKKVDIKNAVQIIMENQRPATKGNCPVCGTEIFRREEGPIERQPEIERLLSLF